MGRVACLLWWQRVAVAVGVEREGLGGRGKGVCALIAVGVEGVG